jgi:hypothetical protein
MKNLIPFILIFYLFSPVKSHSQNDLIGTWVGEFTNDYQTMEITWEFSVDTYHLDMNKDGSIEVSGRWEIQGIELYLWDNSGLMACPETQKGIYKYEISNDILNLTLVEDECPGRRMMGSAIKWIKE